MFRGRSRRGSGKRSYGTAPAKKVPLKGLFADGIWQCNCDPRLPAQHFQTKNGGKHHGRWFYTCQKPKFKGCDFFLFDDEAKGREAAALMNNSRTEPFPSRTPQTPQKAPPYGLATPQTSSRFRTSETNVPAPYTPSKPSHGVNSSPIIGNASHMTTTPGSDSEEEFYDWPASDDDALSKVADQASSRPSLPPPETPRKTIKTNALATPGKRRYDEMASQTREISSIAWPTPSTGDTVKGDIFTTPSASAGGRGLFASASLSPSAETPTPIRYKNLSPDHDSELASEILAVLETSNFPLAAASRDAVKSICNKHVLYTKGIMKGRDVSRAIVKKKDERIAELQGEMEGLKAERETNKDVIRLLKMDLSTRAGS